MGKISYRPRRGQSKNEAKRNFSQNNKVDEMVSEKEYKEMVESAEDNNMVEEINKLSIEQGTRLEGEIQGTKIVGDMGNDYHIYVEDYVYTYIYQLAAADYTRESSAALIGQSYTDSKEILIKGIIPIDMDKLQNDSEWIDMGVMDEVEEVRKEYFKDQQIIGWMHMQPGYGTMLTMKELKEHNNVFEGNGTVCVLIDAINKIESIFVYEEDELKEQSGYCMYYERNEQMQRYMLEHPFVSGAKEEMKDKVVNQFREIGKMRKEEYMQRKNLNLTVMVASVILIALTAVIVKMNDKNILDKNSVQQVSSNSITSSLTDKQQIGTNNLEDKAQIENQTENQMIEGTENVPAIDVQTPQLDEDLLEQPDSLEDKEVEANTDPTTEPIKDEEYDVYIVTEGDTLADICYKIYGSAERSKEVARYNDLDNTNQIYVGQSLKMPK